MISIYFELSSGPYTDMATEEQLLASLIDRIQIYQCVIFSEHLTLNNKLR